MTSIFPVTSRLTFPEMVKGAIVTRAAVSAARLRMTWKAPNEGFTKEQKSASFLERCFMEPMGVLVQVLMLYLTQDAVGQALGKTSWFKLPTADSFKHLGLKAHERSEIAKTIGEVYNGIKTPDMLAKMQYEAKAMAQMPHTVSTLLESRIHPDRLKTVQKAVSQVLEAGFHQRLKFATAGMLGLGVLSSAYFSGSLMQWLNDNVVAHRLIPWINQKLGLVSQSSSGQQSVQPQYIPTPSSRSIPLSMAQGPMTGVPMSQYANQPSGGGILV